MMGRHQYINEDEYEVNLKDFEPQPGKRLSGEAVVWTVGLGIVQSLGGSSPGVRSLVCLQWCSVKTGAKETLALTNGSW